MPPRLILLWSVLAAPIAAGTLAVAWVALAEASGVPAFERGRALNSAEAAGLGDQADVLRFFTLGDDPNRVYPLRSWVLSPDLRWATPTEAAVWSRRIEMIRMLDEAGAIVGHDQRQELACLAADLGVRDVAEYLAPSGASCEAGAATQRVLERTRPRSRGEVR
jgi:hypothetical protein